MRCLIQWSPQTCPQEPFHMFSILNILLILKKIVTIMEVTYIPYIPPLTKSIEATFLMHVQSIGD